MYVPLALLTSINMKLASEGYTFFTCVSAFNVFASFAGPSFEVDLGVRLARHFSLMAIWERAQLGAGPGTANSLPMPPDGLATDSTIESSTSDFLALAGSFESNPDHASLLVELAIGYRQADCLWSDGTELQLDGSLANGRLGIGASFRATPTLSFAPMLTIENGVFTEADWVYPDGSRQYARSPRYAQGGYAIVGLQLGIHLDLMGRR